MKRLVGFLLLFALVIHAQTTRVFNLKTGEKISGVVRAYEDSLQYYIIDTGYGELKIYEKDIMPSEATIRLKSGDKITGELIEDTATHFSLKTSYGLVRIEKGKVEKIDIASVVSDSVDYSVGEEDPAPWYFSDQRMIYILEDPTGYVLDANTLYFSITEWGYGANDKFQFTSNWNAYFWGDLNIRPKLMLFKSGNLETQHAMSIGFHLHMKGPSNRYYFKKYDNYYDYDFTADRWEKIGNDDDERIWGEAFIAYTLSNLRQTGRGRVDVTLGSSMTYYKNYHPMPRAYLGLSSDVRRNLKLFAKILTDAYSPSWYNYINDKEEKNPVKLDFGFIMTDKKGLQIGLHFQRPWIMAYYLF